MTLEEIIDLPKNLGIDIDPPERECYYCGTSTTNYSLDITHYVEQETGYQGERYTCSQCDSNI